jgi:hypothetical protein
MCDVCGLDSFLRLKVDEKRTFFGSYTIKRGVTSIETSLDECPPTLEDKFH